MFEAVSIKEIPKYDAGLRQGREEGVTFNPAARSALCRAAGPHIPWQDSLPALPLQTPFCSRICHRSKHQTRMFLFCALLPVLLSVLTHCDCAFLYEQSMGTSLVTSQLSTGKATRISGKKTWDSIPNNYSRWQFPSYDSQMTVQWQMRTDQQLQVTWVRHFSSPWLQQGCQEAQDALETCHNITLPAFQTEAAFPPATDTMYTCII